MWIHLLIFLCCLAFSEIRGNQDYEIIYPERLHHSRFKRDLSTATGEGHEDSASFALRAFNKNWILDANRNKQLTPNTFVLRQFDSDDTEIISREAPEGCHYQGSIRGNPDSVVVLNTCSGLTGMIDDGTESYNIEPHDNYQDTGAHKIYAAKDEEQFDSHQHCGTQNGEQSFDSTSKESKIKKTIDRLRRDLGHVVNMEEVYRPYLTTDETRYNEVMFVVDNGVYQRYKNDSKTVTEKVATLANAVDAVYQRINVRIVFSAIEIWSNGDRMTRKKTGGAELGEFGSYRKKNLIGKIPHDNAQFLSHHGWGNIAGMAWVGTICGSLSSSINTWSFRGITGPLVVVAHEMGHNFGFGHNTGSCKCLTRKGCFMGGHKTRVPGFSDCNLNSLKRTNDKCLYNVPTQALNSRCGNGIREGDEECDCGTPEMCKKKDPCCLPFKCQLRPSAVCSDLHHSCCKDCQYKKEGTLCRAVKTDCDVPEYCPGDSRDCPADTTMQDGIPCNRTNKLIIANTNRWSVVKNKLSPHIEARYVRINPQYWRGWNCMRTELLGCPADEVNPAMPTPLKAYNDYCIVPKNETCKLSENSRIAFKSGYECKEKYMEFKLDSNGILWHECSQHRVCPENGATGNGVKLVISSSCKDEDSKFVRTSKNSLKHVKSGKCVHPSGGWPGNGRELVLWSGCDLRRLEINFMKPDCIVPLGIRSGAIPDKQMTASSTRGKELPSYARLYGKKYWCAAKKKKTEYLQIDLGKTQTITHVLTQGRQSWYFWVTAYYLLYSQDGVRWTGYTESGDALHSNSYCYSGKCAETLDTQCRNLWGPETNNAAQGCYDKLNTEAKGYGTCNPFSNSSCAAADVLCGQIQCQSKGKTPLVNYAKSYTRIAYGSLQCSAAVLKISDSVGLGMVKDGTKCGNKKMCSKFRCKSFDDLNIKGCPVVNDKTCNGKGYCTNKGKCQCYEDYDPKTGCEKALPAQDGGFSNWSQWSICSAGCNGGKQTRHRFCNNPFPKFGGKDCEGKLQEEKDCNKDACPKVLSCRHLQLITKTNKKVFPDGIYDIYPQGLSNAPVKAYCDFTRDGGGWTLLVTSHTNTWTKDNVELRNADKPSLTRDYSILKHADAIKNNLNVIGGEFEYRLEAQRPDRWGGIWKADRSYTFTAKNSGQTNIKLIKKFDNWKYSSYGIAKRMPWISGAKLTTSASASSRSWGSITGNEKSYHPAPWISGHLMERQPEYIWYWMREGPWKLPRSCMEIQMRGFRAALFKDGIYTIKPPGKQPVKTFCDLTSQGGGWTLLMTSKTHSGWTSNNVKSRNADQPSVNGDFSILGVGDAIKDFDISQDFFQYRIEADGKNQYGGIFDAPREYTFTSANDKQTDVKLVENFNSIGASSNLAKRMPRLGLSSSIFLSTASTAENASGSIVFNEGSDASPSYLPSIKPNPGIVRYWMREGTRRTCFDIKVHGVRKSVSFRDAFYMIRLLNDSSYLSVFCDMTSDSGAYTLVVTSRHNSWRRDQVPSRNIYHPSLNRDYSILKYADLIKNLGHNSTFKYKLDGGQRGHWGGVWRAPHQYSFMSTSNSQTNVKLLQKFDNWQDVWWRGVKNRMPWFVAKGGDKAALLTTSSSASYYPSGSIIWGGKNYNPAYWIYYSGMQNPGVIWYWVNEDDCDSDRKPVHGGLTEWSEWSICKLCTNGKQRRYKTCTNPAPRCGGKLCDGLTEEYKFPRSCLEIQLLGLQSSPYKDGIYTIQPPGKQPVKTYCDMTSRGGGWTLLATSKTHSGWTSGNVKSRNINKPSLDDDFSILGVGDAIKDFDMSHDFFQYRIEADGKNQYGGIFDAPRDYTFTSTSDRQTDVKLVENFNSISTRSNLAKRMPRLGMSSSIFLSTGSATEDASGSIVFNEGSDNSPSYLPSVKPKPGVVRYWMREGTRRSCFDIKIHGVRKSVSYKDDHYMIRLLNDSSYLPVFCDMTSGDGAFTLILTSRHNSWKRDQVPARNVNRPSLNDDYSILKYADLIKNLGHSNTFKYKLDANKRGHWGGIWSAPHQYSFMATSSSQTKVKLLKKFDKWDFSWWKSVQNRMPWFDAKGTAKKALLTTSSSTTYYPAGSIIWGDEQYNPAYWIRYSGMQNPGVIWYWVNEDDCDDDRKPVHGGLTEWSEWSICKLCTNGKQRRYKTCTNPAPRCGGKLCDGLKEEYKFPKSCLEIQLLGLKSSPYKDGIYTIQPPGKQPVKTYCDMTSRGGGWTLLATSKTHSGWTSENVKSRNINKPSLDDDFSILGVGDDIKDFDMSQDFFQYRVEADGKNRYGGIFDAPREYTFTSTNDKQTDVKLVETFNSIDASSNLAKRMPRLGMSSSIFLSTGSTTGDASGSIVFNEGSGDSPSYLPSVKPKPGVVRYWMREGTRRSCFDIKIHGVRKSVSYKDDYYMIRLLNDSSYLPVFCDMTSEAGAFTLILTSRHNSWKRDQVPARNVYHPSLNEDYSILKYADIIKNLGQSNTFKYKLEANKRGHWGGVWSAPHQYSFMATSSSQTNVKLLKKFDKWEFSWWRSVQNRMPWFDAKGTAKKALLTTSSSTTYYPAGSIIWGDKQYNPAYWIRYSSMQNPGVIWYWVNEDDCDADRKSVHGGLTEWSEWSICKLCTNGKQRRYKTCTKPAPRCGGKLCDGLTEEYKFPRSCLEIQLLGLQSSPFKDGIYTIQPAGKQPTKTYCDLTSRGGGWTLLATSKTHSGWTSDNVKSRNINKPSLNDDFSILGAADAIKDFDMSQDFFQYRIEADGENQYGGIFDAPRDYTFTSANDKQTDVKLVENFNSIGASSNLAKRMPRLGMSSSIFLSAGSTTEDASGSIIFNEGSDDSPSYLSTIKPNPGIVRYWMREGTRRSCFDIKINGVRKSVSYKDDYYMIRLLNDSSYLPVFCDMTSGDGAFTLILTSRHNSWKRDQVPARNVYRPSLNEDYSILKYADLIKDLGHGNTFKYKIDANKRGHWGGIWSAPHQYSFMATSNTQTNVKLLKKFDKWEFSWWRSVQNRMPWFDAKGTAKKALLTTSSGTTYYPAGSIIWGDKEYNPAYWIRYSSMQNPGVIWYWVNEDDCAADRKPVHGGLSEWSEWSKCDKCKQRRYRTCTNPVPRCGGRPCDQIAKRSEEKSCTPCTAPK